MDLRLIVPNDWELEIGDSRTVDYAFKEGIENCTLVWKTGSSDIATVDKWGRVTAKAKGQTTVTATSPDGYTDTVKLNVVDSASRYGVNLTKVDYQAGTPVTLGDNLQKIVTRWANASVATAEAIPAVVKEIVSTGVYEGYEEATTIDNALWTIEDFGVKRVDNTAKIERDKVQQFMGDRYFYFASTASARAGVVCAIVADETKNGIWAVTEEGVSFIEMVKLTGTQKAEMMVEDTEKYVQRNGFVADAYKIGKDESGNPIYRPAETDNDGLWTALYAVGELMRYATMKKDPTKYTAEQIAKAKQSAYVSTEAVLLLANISMRTGTYDDTYVRYQPNGRFDEFTYGPNNDNQPKGKYHSWTALEEGGNYSRHLTNVSPAAAFQAALDAFLAGEDPVYMLNADFMHPFVDE
ncbi:MAG: Ig-like domain-containing protein, partial [Clostridia bacterium]|nr:Ig-like domain-containing protein [Clostridia bacterium]